ncbi:hypothetical protein [Methanogenium cariaci]|uniref:hypothetical protein n=1 Tax=Methanogenium cariaci TaxID=2197 RepID=UPI001C47BDFF|nr:hypothetical protein [Methanogenium cariaci]
MTNLEELAQLVLEEEEELGNHSLNIPNLIVSISLIGQTAVRYDMDHSVCFAIHKISNFWRESPPLLPLALPNFNIAMSAIESHSPLADNYVNLVISSIDDLSESFLEIGNEGAVEEILDALHLFAHFANEKREKETVVKSLDVISKIRESAPPGKLKNLAEIYLNQFGLQYPEA